MADDVYENLRVSEPRKTSQRGRINVAVRRPGGFKKNVFKVAAVCVCPLQLAVIIVLAILYGASIKDKNILQSNMTGQKDQLQTSLNDMTGQKDQLQTRLNDMTGQKDQLQTRLNHMTGQKDQLQTSLNDMTGQKDQLQTRLNDMTGQKDQLQTRLNDMTDTKKSVCESHGFTFGGGVCYYISTEGKTWDDSRAYCRARQSDLMTIKSTEKQDFVGRVIGKGKIVWIGLTDRETGVWKWTDGTPLTTPTYWDPGEPNDTGGEEDCVDFFNGGWNDRSCGTSTYWICEKVF